MDDMFSSVEPDAVDAQRGTSEGSYQVELSTPPNSNREFSSVSDEKSSSHTASDAVERLKARIAQRANMDDRLSEVEQAVNNIQRQSVSLSSGQGDIEKIKDFCRKQNAVIMELKKSVSTLEQVCKHLMDTQTQQQHDTELINQALIRLGED